MNHKILSLLLTSVLSFAWSADPLTNESTGSREGIGRLRAPTGVNIPPLNLTFGDAVATSSSEPSTSTVPLTQRSATIADHKKRYEKFYGNLQDDSFIQNFKKQAKTGSLPSTLFRPDENGENVDKLLEVISELKERGLDLDVSYEVQKKTVERLNSVWEVMLNTYDLFIAKAIKSCAVIIKLARDEKSSDRFEAADAYLKGTITNLESFIVFLSQYSDFIQSMLKSQKELLLLQRRDQGTARTHRPTFSNVADKDSVTRTASLYDFSVDHLIKKFKEQLDEAEKLKILLPSVQQEAEDLLERLASSVNLTQSESSTSTATDKTRTQKSHSFRNLFSSSSSRGEASTSSTVSPRKGSLVSPRDSSKGGK